MAGAAVRAAWPALGFGIAYAAAILVGRATRVEGSEVSLIWPAAAVAVLWGIHAVALPARLAAVHWGLLATLTCTVSLATGATAEMAVWFVAVNLALAAIPAVLLRHGERPVLLRDPTDLGRLAVAVGAGTAVSATLATAFFATQTHEGLAHTFALFAVRNGVTALAGVALVLRVRDAQWRIPRPSRDRIVETVGLVVVATVVFGRVFWFNPGLPTSFAVMLPALWISLRYSTTTSTSFLAASGVSIVWATLLDRGALRGIAPQEQALLAQGMVGCLVVVVLTLALFRDSRNELISQLRHLALHDPLTQLANRTLLTDRLDDALARSRPGTVGVVLLDLDGFKRVNDAWGHGEGDLLLVEIARRLHETVRAGDTVARLGGDEFVVVCTRLHDAEELHTLAERIRERVGEAYGQASDAPYDRITASVGIAISEADCTSRSLLSRADHSMYDAKRAGRNRTSPLTPGTVVTGPAAPSAR
ncbi:GGDEF domain-containing protein [Nocardioides sp. Root190]|uniref:GGDEF domain-containing protein n=1 Tax=Nocardioides sp. Root190 TaxID=1736488 RepID=UPI000A55849F|nr:GGDEF domain-containing protein [Nocardioides sp. Root190]